MDKPGNFSNPPDSSGFDLAALQRQDPTEFERLYVVFAPALRLYLARLCGDMETASDIVQETFVKAYRALPRTGPDLQLRSWLYKIATNTAHSTLRLVAWKRVLPFGDHPPKQLVTIEAMLENRYIETELVEHALTAIKPEYAVFLLLYWREGFSLDELCNILALTKDNLKKRLYRAKQVFVAAYAKECVDSVSK